MVTPLRRLPFFFYGTLQTGFQNHENVVRGRFAEISPARAAGLRLVHYPVGFPGAYPGQHSDFVFGQLLTPPADDAVYAALLRELDLLEDYVPGRADNQYDRRVISVEVLDAPRRTVDAFVYVSLLDADSNGAVPVPSGDWRSWMAERGLKDAGDDWSHVLKGDSLAGLPSLESTGDGEATSTLPVRVTVRSPGAAL